MTSLITRDSSESQALNDVVKAAQDDVNGDGQAHLHLRESIRKLTLAVEKPAETLMRHRFEPLRHAAVRMAIEAGLLQAIGREKGNPIDAKVLSKATGYDALLIVRIMRLVTYAGYCEEAGEGEYAANEVTYLVNTPAMTGAERHHFDLFFPIGALLPQYMRETGVHQFPTRPEEKNPFTYAHGVPFWEFFDKFPEHRRDLDEYLSERRKGLNQWHEMFPMDSVLGPDVKRDREAVLFVDVGGGKGHEAIRLQKAHPDIPGRLILQDLPSMIDRVRQNPPEGIELMPYDFFTPQPVKGARVYYFRNICHNWSDEHCRTILTNTAKSMEKGYSRILIDDYVLSNTGASSRGSSMDFLMMLYASGIERAMRQWEQLLETCGLKIIRVWGVDSGHEQIIECQLKT